MTAGGATGRARLRVELGVAAGLAVIGLFLLVHMWRDPAGTPIFGVSADTLPEAMAAVLAAASALLALQSWLSLRRPATPVAGAGTVAGTDAGAEAAPATDGWRGRARLGGLFAVSIAFILALPWLGFLLSGAGLVAASALLLGNRRTVVIVAIAVLAPVLLDQFFEHAMVIFLPAGQLFQ